MSQQLSADFLQAGERARAAARVLRTLTADDKNRALAAIAAHLDKDGDQIAAANAVDVAAAEERGTPAGLLDRLTLSRDRLDAIIEAIAVVRELPDPVGQVVRGYRLPNGLNVEQIRVPMGVVGMIYEARPNVTVDAATLCLKSGNAALLRGSSSVAGTNAALAHAAEPAGQLHLDAGAVAAVVQRRKSLLPAGIVQVSGDFHRGDPVDLLDETADVVARGLVNFDSAELPELLGRSTPDLERELGSAYRREIVHRDDLVVLAER